MTDTAQACEWKYDEFDDKYDTACDNAQTFIADGLKENRYIYCPYCGKKIHEVKCDN